MSFLTLKSGQLRLHRVRVQKVYFAAEKSFLTLNFWIFLTLKSRGRVSSQFGAQKTVKFETQKNAKFESLKRFSELNDFTGMAVA